MADENAILRRYVQTYQEFRANPALLLYSKYIKLVSADEYDAQGFLRSRNEQAGASVDEFLRKGEEGRDPEGSLIKQLVPNRSQRRLTELYSLCRKRQRKFNLIAAKSRGVGFTTWACAMFSAWTATNSGITCAQIAHKPDTVKTIYTIVRSMIRNYPDWFGLNLLPDTQSMIGTNAPDWGVESSWIKTYSATNIDAIRSDRFLMMLKDEAAYVEDHSAFSKAVNSLVMDDPRAIDLDFSTGNGRDDYFYKKFAPAWDAQGGRNLWEEGGKAFRHPYMAAFFPWFYDLSKEAAFDPDHVASGDISYEALFDDLDETERHLYEFCLLKNLEEFNWADKAKHEKALRQLYWRRCKIIAEYNGGLPKVAVRGGVCHTLADFQREEPSNVEDAFSSDVGSPVIPLHIRDMIRKRDCRKPLLVGTIAENRFVSTSSDGYGEEMVWIWKTPDQIKGKLVFGLDPTGSTTREKSTRWDLRRDFNWGVWFEEVDDGVYEQVCEYVTQIPSYVAGQHSLALCRWYGEAAGVENYPFTIIESNIGANAVGIFLEGEYPKYRMYRHVDQRAVNSDRAKWGLYTSESSKAAMVLHWQRMVCENKMILRSERIHDQIGDFIQYEEKKFAARTKGKGGASSKDDGILACCLVAYAEANSGIPRGAQFGNHLDKTAHDAELYRPEHGVDFTGSNMAAWNRFTERCRELGIVNIHDVPTKSDLKARQNPLKPILFS